MSTYTVSLWSTPMPWPLSFAIHPWFVLEHDGVVDRIEVYAPMFVNGQQTVAKNELPPTSGFRSTYFDSPVTPRHTGAATKLHTISGDIDSAAGRLYTIVMRAMENYPYAEQYRIWPGPNSNTFVAWALAQVPEAEMGLSWRAFGRLYPH